MLLRSEGDDGDEVGDFHSFGSAKSYFVNTNLFLFPFLRVYSGLGGGGLLHSKKPKKKARKRKEEEASNMHFDVVTGELVVRADNELR